MPPITFKLPAKLPGTAEVVREARRRSDFIAQLDAMMKENMPDGYRFALSDETGLVGSSVGGFSRTAMDPPEAPAALEDRFNIASMSKVVTAVTVLNLLQSKNLSPDSLVWPFFPSSWKPAAATKKLTFRHFLTHRTGFHYEPAQLDPVTGKVLSPMIDQDGHGLETIRAAVEVGPLGVTNATGAEYRNVNFAAMRVVIPHLNRYDRETQTIAPLVLRAGVAMETALAEEYVSIVNDRVLAPSCIARAGCDSKTLSTPKSTSGAPPIRRPAKFPVLCYPFKVPDFHGRDSGDQTPSCGAQGWSLSVLDLAKLLQTVFFTEVVLSEKSRAFMLLPGHLWGKGLGMNMASAALGGAASNDPAPAWSVFYGHAGWIPFEGVQLGGILVYYSGPGLFLTVLTNVGHDPARTNWWVRAQDIFRNIYTP